MRETESNGRVLVGLDRLVFSYEDNAPVLDGASLSVSEGERIGLTGSIGSGKTTLLHIIVGLIKPQAGTVRAFGAERKKEHDFWEVRERVGLLFQDPEDQLFCPTVREDVAFGPLNQGRTREETSEIVSETLISLGLGGYADRITHHLSGGEKSLVSIASVLAMKPDLLLLDEPTTGLDPDSFDRVRSILLSLSQAMIIVSHDERFIRQMTTRQVRIEGGRLTDL
ncbi:MAG: ABC transporter ATP-binding protein [Candidatus Krumholzibacteriota bacterium]|nr:ABC transporter ATP-binding protein [Candidatus Krumholzibacteriota bacterium]